MRTAGWPAPSRVPLQPRELAERGLCGRHPNPEWWISGRPLEREAAAAVCGHCPVLEACRTWSLSLPSNDNGIYAGAGTRARQQLRKAAREPVAAPPAGEEITPAASLQARCRC